LHTATGIAAVYVSALDERKASPRALQDALGSISILDARSVHLDGEQSSIRIG
jgi:hypothetical protein